MNANQRIQDLDRKNRALTEMVRLFKSVVDVIAECDDAACVNLDTFWLRQEALEARGRATEIRDKIWKT